MIESIRAFLAARRARRILNRPPADTGQGFVFAGARPMMEGRFEPTETALLRRMLAEADLFVNVGANFGYFVCLAQSLGVPVVAVEPVPVNVEILRRNLRANGFEDGVELHHAACGAETGEAEIFGVGTGASLVAGWADNSPRLAHRVPVRRLDDLVPPGRVSGRSVFLVDVEGFELEVLRGAEGILSAPEKPVWLIESGLSGHHRAEGGLNAAVRDVFDILAAHGYRVLPVDAPDRPVTRALIERSLAEGRDLVGGWNFLLLPEGRETGRASESRACT